MRELKITEIKVTAGKDVILIAPKSLQVIMAGKSFFVDEKLAAKLFKAVSGPCETFVNALKEFKE
jgi:hypothetical protein